MRVVAYDPLVSAERFREGGVESDTLEGVLGRSDFVTLHLPLTDETRGVIDARALASMKDGARLVNAARGELVDEQALIDALVSGRLAGAALDVYVREPYDGPLLGAPNIVLTPHLAASTDEAQDRAGVIVAEQVVAALEGGLVTNAVNIPSVGADDLEVLGPFLPLAASLGRVALALARGEPGRITLEYAGELAEYDTRLLTVAALNGAFRGRVDQPVNYVNAALVAAERGIEVVEQRRRHSPDFTNLIAVSAGAARVAGTTIGTEHRGWLVSALGFEVEIELSPRMVVLRYDDVPGVIGRVGTTLGEAGVNIANMAVSRNREAGKALMVLSLDTPASARGARAPLRGRRRRLRRARRARLSRRRGAPRGRAAPPAAQPERDRDVAREREHRAANHLDQVLRGRAQPHEALARPRLGADDKQARRRSRPWSRARIRSGRPATRRSSPRSGRPRRPRRC